MESSSSTSSRTILTISFLFLSVLSTTQADLLTGLPMSILDKLDVLPKFVGHATSNGTLQWQASCFKRSQAWLEFTSKGGELKLKLADPENFWCGDVYLFATPYQFKVDYYIKRGTKQLEFEWKNQADYEYVQKNGISIFSFQASMWSTVAELAHDVQLPFCQILGREAGLLNKLIK